MIKDFEAYNAVFFVYSGDYYYYVENISFCKGGGETYIMTDAQVAR